MGINEVTVYGKDVQYEHFGSPGLSCMVKSWYGYRVKKLWALHINSRHPVFLGRFFLVTGKTQSTDYEMIKKGFIKHTLQFHNREKTASVKMRKPEHVHICEGSMENH